MNLGVGDTGPLAQLGILKEYAAALKPRTVLWFFYEGNDLITLRLELKNPSLKRYLQAGFRQGLIRHHNKIDQAVLSHIDEAREHMSKFSSVWGQRIYTVLSLRYLRARLGIIVDSGGEEMLPALKNVLAEGKAEVARWGGELVFVYLPGWQRYYGGSGLASEEDTTRLAVLTRVRSMGIPVIDIHEIFAALDDPAKMFPRPGKHYNKLGNQTAATAILEELAEIHD